METYLQKQFAKKHQHRYYVEYGSGEAVCICSKIKGSVKAKKGEFNSATCRYGDILYDSIFEANYARHLDWRLKANGSERIKEWKRQVPIRIQYNGETICTLWVDFVVEHMDGSFELCETKGWESELFKIKKRMLEIMWLPEHLNYRYTLVK